MAQKDIKYYSQPNVYGTKFKTSERTAALLDKTKYRLHKRGKGEKLVIIQGSFNTSVDASAGTHDKDAVLDVRIDGMDWYQAQRFLRELGWAAWVRTPAQGFSYHIHMVALPKFKLRWVAPVGEYVPGQVNDYYNHEDGLAGGGHDSTWFPEHIRRTIFNYRVWKAEETLRKQIDRAQHKISEWRKELRKLRDRLRNKRN